MAHEEKAGSACGLRLPQRRDQLDEAGGLYWRQMATLVEVTSRNTQIGAETRRRSWLPYAALALAVVLAFWLQYMVRPVPGFPYDDPFIDLHSAQVLHFGHDVNYPGVPALFGVTSAPFVLLIYLLLFVLQPLQALNVACWVGVLFYGLGLLRLGRVLGLSVRQQWCAVFIGFASAPIPMHLLNGLETSCALAAITWTLCFASGERRGGLAAALMAGVTACFRPDLILFTLVLVGFLGWRSAGAQAGWKQVVRCTAPLVLLAIIPVACCAAWYFHQIGTPFPLTGVAKRYFFAEDHWPIGRRLQFELGELFLFAVAVGPLGWCLLRGARYSMGKALAVVWILFLAALFFQFPEEFGVNEFRYPVVLIPTLLWGLGMLVKRESLQRLLYICTAYAAVMIPVSVHYYRAERAFFQKGPQGVTNWCLVHLPSGTSVLVHDAGYLAYSTDLRTIDFVGLKTPSAIPLNKELTWPDAESGRPLAVAQLARQTGARYLILNSRWWPVVSLSEGMSTLGWKVKLLDSEGAFRIYSLTAPEEIRAAGSQTASTNQR